MILVLGLSSANTARETSSKMPICQRFLWRYWVNAQLDRPKGFIYIFSDNSRHIVSQHHELYTIDRTGLNLLPLLKHPPLFLEWVLMSNGGGVVEKECISSFTLVYLEKNWLSVGLVLLAISTISSWIDSFSFSYLVFFGHQLDLSFLIHSWRILAID